MGKLYFTDYTKGDYVKVKELEVKENGNIQGLVKISIFLLVLVGLNPDWYSMRLVWWGVAGFSSIVMIFFIMKESIPVINLYTIWMFIFFLWSTISYFWAITPEFSVDIIKTLFVNMIVFWLLSCIIQTERDIMQLLELIAYAIVIIAVYMLFSMDLGLVGEKQIGVDILGEKWNGNSIGIMMAFATMISLVIIKKTNKRPQKATFLIIMIFTTVIALFTGSRKAVFFILFGGIMFTILSSRKQKMTVWLGIPLVLLVFYLLIMNVPALYNVLGWRLEGLDALITGKGEIDSSTQLRVRYIEYGISFFKEQPILGHGANNFRTLLGHEIGKITYSHNNYIEILVNLGVIGFIVHYFGYFYILKKTVVPALLKRQDPIYAFSFVMLVTILFAQYGWVTYFDFLVNLFLCVAFLLIKVKGMGINGKR